MSEIPDTVLHDVGYDAERVSVDMVTRMQALARNLYAHGWTRPEIAQLIDTLRDEAMRQAARPPSWAQFNRQR